jgi:sn-glycerol 3-phosphate transport system ATP-binding protein
VRFEKVSKSFGGHAAVRDVDLEAQPGECLVLLGPSGCGKTTLLRLLAGLETVDAGRITIGDRVVNDVPPADRDVAMVFQNYALYPHLTVRENIAFPLRARRVASGEVEARVGDAASRLELSTLLDRRPAQLSGGQQQRVALARAIVRRPAVYLMDEPLSNLDAQLRAQTRGELKRLQQELGTTTVYVTHDQGEAMTLGARVALLRAGRVEQLGAPLELYRRPVNRFVAGFLGSPPINLLPASFHAPGRLRAAGAIVEMATAPVGAVEVGIRPEDVEVATHPSDGFAPAHLVTAEPMGNETVVTMDANGSRVVARAAPDFAADPGTPLFFRFARGRALLFDTASGIQIPESRS